MNFTAAVWRRCRTYRGAPRDEPTTSPAEFYEYIWRVTYIHKRGVTHAAHARARAFVKYIAKRLFVLNAPFAPWINWMKQTGSPARIALTCKCNNNAISRWAQREPFDVWKYSISTISFILILIAFRCQIMRDNQFRSLRFCESLLILGTWYVFTQCALRLK